MNGEPSEVRGGAHPALPDTRCDPTPDPWLQPQPRRPGVARGAGASSDGEMFVALGRSKLFPGHGWSVLFGDGIRKQGPGWDV